MSMEGVEFTEGAVIEVECYIVNGSLEGTM